jgi:hypothetical protein
MIVRENNGFQSKNARRNLETTTKNKINMLNQHNIQIDTSTKNAYVEVSKDTKVFHLLH